jgi:osmoprotectant transport system permease protein
VKGGATAMDARDLATTTVLIGEHLRITGVALGVSVPPALATGYAALAFPRLGDGILKTLGVLYTIPGLALMIFFLPWFGLNERSVIAALVVYAQFPLTQNWVSALRSVEPAAVEAAVGMGMSRAQAFWRVQLPLASPGIVAGLRIAAVAVVGLATLGAKFNAGGLGRLLFDGVAQASAMKIWLGAAALAAVSLMTHAGLLAAERRLGFFAGSKRVRENP